MYFLVDSMPMNEESSERNVSVQHRASLHSDKSNVLDSEQTVSMIRTRPSIIAMLDAFLSTSYLVNLALSSREKRSNIEEMIEDTHSHGSSSLPSSRTECRKIITVASCVMSARLARQY